MSASAPPYVGRLHGVLAVLPSTRIASVAHVELDQSFPHYWPMAVAAFEKRSAPMSAGECRRVWQGAPLPPFWSDPRPGPYCYFNRRFNPSVFLRLGSVNGGPNPAVVLLRQSAYLPIALRFHKSQARS